MKYTVAGLFGGVGGIELGFYQAKFDVVWANEIDERAAITYNYNHNHCLLVEDIHDVKAHDIPDVDIITGGFPCQAFSIAGYQKGFEDDRGNLFFEILRLVTLKRPRVVFLENVKNLKGHDKGNTFKVIIEALEYHGYHVHHAVLNATEYGNTPQNRERIYIVAFLDEKDYTHFEFPDPIPLTRTIADIINFKDKLDDRYYYTAEKNVFYPELVKSIVRQDTVYQWRRKYVRENKSGVCPTLTANMGTGGHNVPLILTDHGIRKLTPRECFLFQGFPDDFNLPEDIADSHLYKQAGNSVVVPVIRRIAEKIYEAFEANSDYQRPNSDEQLVFPI